MIKAKKIIALALLLATAILLISCSGKEADVRIGGNSIYFVTDKNMQKWEENIEKLLANTRLPVISDDVRGEILGYEAADPSLPSVELGYDYGLLDTDLDGVPELIINLGGGSAGNAYYAVYDIMTGESRGFLDGGFDGDFCVYADAKNGFALVGEYVWRSGWDTRMHFTDVIATRGETENTASLYAEYYLSMDESGEYLSHGTFSIGGAEADIDEYLIARAKFEKSNIRISETALILIPREKDWSEESAAKIARALITSGQRFIDVKKSIQE